MSEEDSPSPVKGLLELETALGYRHIFDERGMPRISVVALLVGFTAILILLATFVNWLWWIPAGIFVFGLAMMFFSYYMMRRQRRQEEKKGV